MGVLHQGIPVFREGIEELCEWLVMPVEIEGKRKALLLTEKAFKIISHYRMKNVDKVKLQSEMVEALKRSDFNIYKFVDQWI